MRKEQRVNGVLVTVASCWVGEPGPVVWARMSLHASSDKGGAPGGRGRVSSVALGGSVSVVIVEGVATEGGVGEVNDLSHWQWGCGWLHRERLL